MIEFHRPSIGALEQKYAGQALELGGSFCARAQELFRQKTGVSNMTPVTSGTHALELAALACDIKPGDEVILPSYTFTSTANAFLLRGAKPVFCEVDPRTMNADAGHIEKLITKRTRAIAPVHYAGVVCDMDAICGLAREHGLYVIEDAAQAVGSRYNGRPAGALSDAGCYSFHQTKNYTCGEGGGVVFSSPQLRGRAEIIREKGTDRSGFLRGEVEKYTWQDIGSSYVLSDILAAVLTAQLERFDEIMQKRMAIWTRYHAALCGLEERERLVRPYIPPGAGHNAHMYYIILSTPERRDELLRALFSRGIQAATHYQPLHSSSMGRRLGYRESDLPVTANRAARLLRLPLYTDMPLEMADMLIEAVQEELHAPR